MHKFYLFIVVLIITGCNTENSTTSKQEYLRWVGDIEFDSALDDPIFKLCNGESNVKQYFNFSQGLQYDGEKKSINDDFKLKYKPVESEDSGLVRVRFIVNCKGKTDRFRIIGMDNNFIEKEFDALIIDQLIGITKELKGWKILPNSEQAQDYYQYLIFKIDKGNIIEILP